MDRLLLCFSVVLILECLGIESGAVRLLPIYWNSSNPIFRRDNTDHVKSVEVGDTMDILCPKYPLDFPEEDAEYHVIYQVSREDYDACHITHSKTTRQILACNTPFREQMFTISFREFTPVPLGLEFQRGKDYYYISTSNGSQAGMKNLNGGGCFSHNMRLVFKVCCSETATLSSVTSEPSAKLAGSGSSIITSLDRQSSPTNSESEISTVDELTTDSAIFKPTYIPIFPTTRKKFQKPSENEVLPQKAVAAFLNSTGAPTPSFTLACLWLFILLAVFL